jgi:lysyl-tRNA synthetase class 2
MHTNDWAPTASIESLKLRAEVLRQTREYFDNRGFFEVQTPCLSHETVVDTHLEPISVAIGNKSYFLQTSPEAAMKRLMAAGAQSIYQIGPVFRRDEFGVFHNLEFTMLEWYRAGDDLALGIECLTDFVSALTNRPQATRVTYRHLFRDCLGFDPLTISMPDLAQQVLRCHTGYEVHPSDDRDTLLDVLMGLVIQPQLKGSIVVSNYPLSQAALARSSEDDPLTAERYELFIDGIEIANGYSELLDADVLQARSEENNRLRALAGRNVLPVPWRLIQAMRQGLPLCSGTALGFDRLVMSVTGANEIGSVLAFPLPIA